MTGQDRAALHKEMFCRIADLESLMAELGDSRPPITRKDLLDIKKTIAALKAQPAVGPIMVPDYTSAMAAEMTLKRIASKSAGHVHLPFWLARWHIALMKLARSVSDWLH